MSYDQHNDDYIVDGVRMSNMSMFQFTVCRYGGRELIITDTKAVSVLMSKGHDVQRLEPKRRVG